MPIPTTPAAGALPASEPAGPVSAFAPAQGSGSVLIAQSETVEGLETWIPINASTLFLCDKQTGPFVTTADYMGLMAQTEKLVALADSLLCGKDEDGAADALDAGVRDFRKWHRSLLPPNIAGQQTQPPASAHH